MDDNKVIADKTKEKIGKLSRTTGKQHIFLGMEIKFIGGKKVTVYTPHHVG